jgi:hypothetical protein
MDKQQHIHELIDQYLMGELVGQELDKFRIRLKDDPAFLEQVQIQKAIINSIELGRKAELKSLLQASKAKKRALILPFGNRSLAIAASILSLLAFGLIIKTVMPDGFGDLAKNETPTEVEEVKQNTNQEEPKPVVTEDDGDVDITHDSLKVVPSPEIAIVEDQVNDANAENTSTFDFDDDTDLAELKKDEDDIDGSDFKPSRDSLLGSQNVTLFVVAYEITKIQTTEVDEKVTEVKKEGLFNRKNKEKSKTDEIADKAETGSASAKALVKKASVNIRVEFWESIVGFKGYKYDGSKLLLFDTPVNASIQLKSHEGKTYVNKNGVFYSLNANNQFNQMSRVTNADLLTILNTK